ncbi:unnamed protein product [Didymodactylos carnosus]|nr:unnamed protein product [Didymodactylos carnosus]CAF3720884.1 unnamed protein product [Didymodactylos carnosus]
MSFQDRQNNNPVTSNNSNTLKNSFQNQHYRNDSNQYQAYLNKIGNQSHRNKLSNTDRNTPNNPDYRYPNNPNQAISKEAVRSIQDDYDEDLIFQDQQYT